MRPEPGGTCYEYIAVYVDDLAIAAKDPQAFCNELKKKYNLKLKGVGPLEYHLGCTYKKDPDGTLAADPRRYVNKILESYERMFKEKARKSRPPLEGGDHPELDTSELCDDHQTKQVQTLIGQLQWLISLGRFHIAVHVSEVCYLLEVSWQMCHAWITHWTVARAILTMSRRRSTRDECTHGRDVREPLLACT